MHGSFRPQVNPATSVNTPFPSETARKLTRDYGAVLDALSNVTTAGARDLLLTEVDTYRTRLANLAADPTSGPATQEACYRALALLVPCAA